MSQHHARIKNDPRWKAARAECLERDGYTCQDRGPRCLVTEQLEADHVLPLAEYPELAFEVENLRTLCRPCHQDKGQAGTTALSRFEWVNDRYNDLAELLAARPDINESESDGPVF